MVVPATMPAAVLESGRNRLEIREVPVPRPGRGEIQVEIQACGVCGSDVHLVLHGSLKCRSYPQIPGHEAAGIVTDCGPGTSLRPGQRVVLSAGTSCGACAACKAGRENYCPDLGVFGFDRPGSFARYNVVPERFLFPVPDGIPLAEAAILADAVSTPYAALKRGTPGPEDTIAIFGCGGLGIHAVAMARLMTRGPVIALDVDGGALQNALAYGADQALDLRGVKNAGKLLKEKTDGVDLVLDFSGRMQNIQDAVRAMQVGGRMVLVGISRDALSFSLPFLLIERQISLLGSYGSDHTAIPELLQLYSEGRLNLSRSITAIRPLEEINVSLEDLSERRGNPIRFVIKP